MAPLTRILHLRIPEALAVQLDRKLKLRRARHPDTTMSSYVRDLIAADISDVTPPPTRADGQPALTKSPDRAALEASLRENTPAPECNGTGRAAPADPEPEA